MRISRGESRGANNGQRDDGSLSALIIVIATMFFAVLFKIMSSYWPNKSEIICGPQTGKECLKIPMDEHDRFVECFDKAWGTKTTKENGHYRIVQKGPCSN